MLRQCEIKRADGHNRLHFTPYVGLEKCFNYCYFKVLNCLQELDQPGAPRILELEEMSEGNFTMRFRLKMVLPVPFKRICSGQWVLL